MKKCIISFSGRKEGNCKEAAKIMMAHSAKDEVSYYDFSIHQVHGCGDCHYECFKQCNQCPYYGDDLINMYRDISLADVSYWIVPDYTGYPCSNFFKFNERGVCYFWDSQAKLDQFCQAKKKFIVISNGEKDNFEKAFGTLTGKVKPEILFLSSHRYGKDSLAGDLMTSDEARKALIDFLDEQQ